MDQKTAEKIFKEHNLAKVESFQKVEIGFTNKVYLVNDKYILKVCEDESNEKKFEIEVYLYNFFKGKIPVPEIKIFDKSKSIYGRFFMIYPKIEGDNLYAKWHLLSDEQRKNIIEQLCDILKIINKSPYYEFEQKFKINLSENWHDKILRKTQNSLIKVEKKKLLSPEFTNAIRKFVDDNHQVLKEEKLALVFWDAHFDNILVQGAKIVGILDFERTEISSLDYILDIVKRMVEYPKKYMSEKFEKFAKKEDYAHLLEWFEEFYPELFEFKNLDKRLDLYAVEYDLNTLIWYPDSKEVKQAIAKTVRYDQPVF